MAAYVTFCRPLLPVALVDLISRKRIFDEPKFEDAIGTKSRKISSVFNNRRLKPELLMQNLVWQ
jgi:hypothetical protein